MLIPQNVAFCFVPFWLSDTRAQRIQRFPPRARAWRPVPSEEVHAKQQRQRASRKPSGVPRAALGRKEPAEKRAINALLTPNGFKPPLHQSKTTN